jgi:hypothetical protein
VCSQGVLWGSNGLCVCYKSVCSEGVLWSCKSVCVEVYVCVV